MNVSLPYPEHQGCFAAFGAAAFRGTHKREQGQGHQLCGRPLPAEPVSGATRLTEAITIRGYDYSDTTRDLATPVGVGNVAAEAVIQARRNDGSNQYGDLHPGAYSDYTGYVPRNAPLPYCVPSSTSCVPATFADKDNWQPLVSSTGATQSFIAPHWERVRPFALPSPSQYDGTLRLEIQILQVLFWKGVNEALQYSAELTEQRNLIIEYWADGPASELPPGHWGVFAQFVSRRDNHSIDTDAKMFFAMHNASFDAGIVAWHFKRKFDGARPFPRCDFKSRGIR